MFARSFLGFTLFALIASSCASPPVATGPTTDRDAIKQEKIEQFAWKMEGYAIPIDVMTIVAIKPGELRDKALISVQMRDVSGDAFGEQIRSILALPDVKTTDSFDARVGLIVTGANEKQVLHLITDRFGHAERNGQRVQLTPRQMAFLETLFPRRVFE